MAVNRRGSHTQQAQDRPDTPVLFVLDDDVPTLELLRELARDLRRDGRLDDVPVVVCTAAAPTRRAEITGWAPVLTKPFELAQIEEFLLAARGDDGPASDEAAG